MIKNSIMIKNGQNLYIWSIEEEINVKLLSGFVALLVLAACSGTPKKVYDPGAFALIRTIELRDATDPLLLASTSAESVRKYLEIGLQHRGYTVCNPCDADAVATITVSEYSTQQDITFTRGVIVHGNVADTAWSFVVESHGKTIFQKRIRHRKIMAIDQLSARQVKDVLDNMSPR